MKNFYRFSAKKFVTFLVVAVFFNFIQWLIWKNGYIFYQLNINHGNVPSYVVFSLDVLERFLGSSAIYPPGQSWFRFPYGGVYLLVLTFWAFVWYTIACLIHRNSGDTHRARR